MSGSTLVVSTLILPNKSFHCARDEVRTLSKSKSGISSSAFAQAWVAEIKETPTLARIVVVPAGTCERNGKMIIAMITHAPFAGDGGYVKSAPSSSRKPVVNGSC